MHPTRLFFIFKLLWLTFLCTDSVKIGVSKHITATTTYPPSTTLADNTTDEMSTEVASSTSSSTSTTTKATTISPSTPEAEWPEFPPKKTSNGSNKTTTKKPVTTTPKTSTTATVSPNIPTNETNTTVKPETPVIFLTSIPQWPTKEKYCFCDLTQDTCDINCCCDQDCTPEALQVFKCLTGTPIDLEIHEGRFEDFKFIHGLPSCEVNDGWLCVFRTYKPIEKNKVAYSFEDTSRFYKWPNMLLESEDVKSREFYKFGDILRIINIETKEIQNFDLPSSFQSFSCQIQEPIYHLKSTQRSCFIPSSNYLKEMQHKLLQLGEKYKIFNTPTIPDDLYNNKSLNRYIGNITIKKCFKGNDICEVYKPNKKEEDKFDLIKVKVNILHNFTNIQEVIVNIWPRDLKDNNNLNSNTSDFWLIYETEFFNKTLKEFNLTKEKAAKKLTVISGPLGYLTGKPIILARYEPFNKSLPLSTKNRVINYFSSNNAETHTLALFAKENGKCKRFKPDKDLISFGINVAKYCKLKLENYNLLNEDPTNTNFTKICLDLQQRIYDQLFGQDLIIEKLSSYLVSELGKPENNSNKWLRLQVYNTDFDSVVGQYLQETNTFVCRNILLSLTYEFHMAYFMVDNIPLQNVIKHAALHLAERHDLEFALDENLEVPITMTARFFDVHEKAVSAGFYFKNLNLIYFIIIIIVFSILS